VWFVLAVGKRGSVLWYVSGKSVGKELGNEAVAGRVLIGFHPTPLKVALPITPEVFITITLPWPDEWTARYFQVLLPNAIVTAVPAASKATTLLPRTIRSRCPLGRQARYEPLPDRAVSMLSPVPFQEVM